MKLLSIRDAIHYDYPISRKLERIVIHCTGTTSNVKPESILNYWKNTLGWKNPGYHILIGTSEDYYLQPFNKISNGVYGFNSKSVHIAYIGGIEKVTSCPVDTDNLQYEFKDTTNGYQKDRLVFWIKRVKELTPYKLGVVGHNDLDQSRKCPCFDVKTFIKNLKI